MGDSYDEDSNAMKCCSCSMCGLNAFGGTIGIPSMAQR